MGIKEFILPGLASAFVIPGLGQIINGQVVKGLVFLALVFLEIFGLGFSFFASVSNSEALKVEISSGQLGIWAALSRGEFFWTKIFAIAFLITWTIGVADALKVGARRAKRRE